MILEWPQIVMIILLLPEFGFQVAMHGKPKEGNHSAWFTLSMVTLYAVVLYYGGFWTGGSL